MSFRERESGMLESTDGYTVDNRGHHVLRYIEQDHVATFHVEPGTTAYLYDLSEPTRWDAPFAAEVVSADRDWQIKERIIAALQFRGLAADVQVTRFDTRDVSSQAITEDMKIEQHPRVR